MGLFPNDRDSLRRMYAEAWRRHVEGMPIDPLQAQIADVVAAHPEYQGLLEGPEDNLHTDWTPEGGRTNPFLHMGMHLALHEQLDTDRPAGIREIHARLAGRLGGRHAAEHAMMECLGAVLWEAQRTGLPPDEDAYIVALKAL
jgi:hypothetical protein